MTKEEKRALREYKKMEKRHKKKIKKLAKEFECWDWKYFHYMVVGMLEMFLEYYENGYYVIVDQNEVDIMKKEMEKVLGYLEEYDKAYNFYLDYPAYKEGESDEQTKERLNALKMSSKIESKAFEDFYKYLGKYLRNWWS